MGCPLGLPAINPCLMWLSNSIFHIVEIALLRDASCETVRLQVNFSFSRIGLSAGFNIGLFIVRAVKRCSGRDPKMSCLCSYHHRAFRLRPESCGGLFWFFGRRWLDVFSRELGADRLQAGRKGSKSNYDDHCYRCYFLLLILVIIYLSVFVDCYCRVECCARLPAAAILGLRRADSSEFPKSWPFASALRLGAAWRGCSQHFAAMLMY